MIGRDKLFVCWLETVPETIPDLRGQEANSCPPQPDAAAAQLTSEITEPLSD